MWQYLPFIEGFSSFFFLAKWVVTGMQAPSTIKLLIVVWLRSTVSSDFFGNRIFYEESELGYFVILIDPPMLSTNDGKLVNMVAFKVWRLDNL